MKPYSNTAPRNAQAQNHPPLARDAYGNPQSIPEGAVGWCLKRETGGRPKMIVGADRQPARFPLDLTADDIEEMVGAGTYRVYAIGADGEVLDYVTTVSVGESVPTEPEPAPASPGPLRGGASSDLRFALETILQMSRAQSDSLKAVALAQADWVKGLATAKALPRNGHPMPAPPPAYRVLDEPENDDDDDDDDDNSDEPASARAASPWLDVVTALAPVIQTYSDAWMKKSGPATPAVPQAPRNASPETPAEGEAPATVAPNPMIHLSEINARLTAFERKFLNVLMRGQHGGQVSELLIAMSVDDAVAFVRENVARVQAERHAATGAGETSSVDAPPVDAPPSDAPPEAPPVETSPAEMKRAPAASGGLIDFMPRVLAASAYLTAEEKAAVMWLVPRIPAARLEELKAKLQQMTPRDAAMWIRDNLAVLRAEVSS